MTGFHTAVADSLSIPLMQGISPELMAVNTRDDIKRWWEVVDRTAGRVVPPQDWSYDEKSGNVTVHAVERFHEYTVSFLAYLICSGKSGTGYYPHPVKPDLVVYDSPNGTSFSTPVVTGLCAVLMGYRPMERRELIRLLHASGTRSAAPDLETGYPHSAHIIACICHRTD